MIRNSHIAGRFALLFSAGLFILALSPVMQSHPPISGPAAQVFQKLTATPIPIKLKPVEDAVVSHSGNTDLILVLAILIVIVIIIPILLRRKDWRGNQ